ncbi:MAG: hypothetical protein ACLTLL_05775 [Acutalibacteraceae bacterium]
MNNIEALEKYALSLECSAERGVSMKNYTSFKVGGPAELFLSPEDAGQTASLFASAKKRISRCSSSVRAAMSSSATRA